MSGTFKILFSLFYTISYFFLAILSTGGGHGNLVVLAPFITWILILIAVGISGKTKNLVVRIFFILLMFLHYIQILIFISPIFSQDFYQEKLTNRQLQPITILIVTLWYLIGQIVIWAMFYKGVKNKQ